MIHSKKPADAWREALKVINRCPICSENYQVDKARLLINNEAASLVHITCQKCQSYFVAMIVLLGSALSSVGMVTDLSFEDVGRLNKLPSLTIDDTIEGYQCMQNKNFLHSLI